MNTRSIATIAAAVAAAAAALAGCASAKADAPPALPAAPALPATAGTFAPAAMPTVPRPAADTTPILILATPAQDARWHITAAARAWNTATGCTLFTTEVDGLPHLTYRVVETTPLRVEDGRRTAAQTIYPWDDAHDKVIMFDPTLVGAQGAAAHELGHDLGVEHTPSTDEVMSGSGHADRSILRAHEADMAIDLQPDRCPGTHYGHDTPVDVR